MRLTSGLHTKVCTCAQVSADTDELLVSNSQSDQGDRVDDLCHLICPATLLVLQAWRHSPREGTGLILLQELASKGF